MRQRKMTLTLAILMQANSLIIHVFEYIRITMYNVACNTERVLQF